MNVSLSVRWMTTSWRPGLWSLMATFFLVESILFPLENFCKQVRIPPTVSTSFLSLPCSAIPPIPLLPTYHCCCLELTQGQGELQNHSCSAPARLCRGLGSAGHKGHGRRVPLPSPFTSGVPHQPGSRYKERGTSLLLPLSPDKAGSLCNPHATQLEQGSGIEVAKTTTVVRGSPLFAQRHK